MAKITPDNISDYTKSITDLYNEFELSVYLKIISYLVDEKEYTAEQLREWQVSKLSHVRGLERYASGLLSKTSKSATKEIRSATERASEDTLSDIDEEVIGLLIAAKTKKPPSNPLPKAPYKDIVDTQIKRMFDDINVNVNQHLLTNNFGRGSVTREYENIINRVANDVLISRKTVRQAVEDAVIQSANKGLPSGFVDKGGYRWSVRRYMDNTVGSVVNDAYNEIRTRRMQEYDIYTVLVSSLPNPAPRCQHIQGTIADTRPIGENTSGFHSVYEFGYGTPGGTKGRNCRHQWFPYIRGANTNNQPRYSNKEAEEAYKVLQRQRTLERRIRASKEKVELYNGLGNKDKARRYELLKRKQQKEIRELVANNENIGRNYAREKVY